MTKITQDNAHSTLCIVHESCDGTQTDCRAANGMRPGFAAVEAEGEADGEEAVAEAVRDADYAARGWLASGCLWSARRAAAGPAARPRRSSSTRFRRRSPPTPPLTR